MKFYHIPHGVTILFLLLTLSAFGQMVSDSNYSWDYVVKKVKECKSITAGTRAIISDIAVKYDTEKEQRELIEFYKSSFDYKIVDKLVLKNLIDSLIQYGINEEVKLLANDTKFSIEYRLLNKKIKDLKLPDKNGNQISLTSLNDKIVIIELWATWCAPCIKEMPKIPRLKELNTNIEFYSISLDKTSGKMKKFVEKNKYKWPIVFGGDKESNKELWEYLNIVAIPKYYVVDREGVVISVADRLDEQFIESLK